VARIKLPRVVVAGLAGDSGKTLVSLGLVRALGSKNLKVAPFKKGPDFIDAAWLGVASGEPGRNLDTFLMPEKAILGSLARAGLWADVAVIEGNRGLFDGMDAGGTHSTAKLGKLIGAPVVLVLDCTKSTRTVAAQVMGCQVMDPDVEIAGVILNRVGTSRQESVIREAVSAACGVPVLGAIPRLLGEFLPSRHLGLVTAMEHPRAQEALERVAEAVRQHVDIKAVLDIARRAADLEGEVVPPDEPGIAKHVRIGVLRDAAFSFYYPENIEALERAGAELISISPLEDQDLPDVDALYAGGGFPEVYAARLSANRRFCERLASEIADGLPVWAECGGLMYLSRALSTDEVTYHMVGALPVVVEQTEKPQGHGYMQVRVDADNPFFEKGTELRGHEFHYSRLEAMDPTLETVLSVRRGEGLGGGRDGIRVDRVLAAYTHLHALGSPDWATNFVRAAAGRKESRASQRLYQEPAIRSGEMERKGKLRQQVEQLVRERRLSELDILVAGQPRAVRHLLSLSYQPDQETRKFAAQGIALASRHHQGLVQNVVRRLIWAMNDESGTNAQSAPAVLQAIAEEDPELLLPVLGDIIRLAADEGLYQGLAKTLRIIKESCPGKIGRSLGEALNRKISKGELNGVGSAI
jgi:cobyrinic acid a,c-diamide synthase